MKKKVILCIVGMFILLGVMILVIFNYKVYRKLELINVNVSNYDEENRVLKINLQRKVSPFNSDFYCHADGVKNTYNVKGENNKCELVLDINDSYTLYLSNSKNDKSNVIKLNDVFNGVLSFKFKNDTLYMIKDEKKVIDYYDVVLDKKVDYSFKSSDSNIIDVVDGKIIAKSEGNAYVYSDKIQDKLNVVVTNIITKPYATKDKKLYFLVMLIMRKKQNF